MANEANIQRNYPLLGELRWFGLCLAAAVAWAWFQSPPEFGLRFILQGAVFSATLLYGELAVMRLIVWGVRRALRGKGSDPGDAS